MTRRPQLLDWRDGALVPVDEVPGDPVVLVADSWLVDEGRMLALDAHRARFRAAAVDALPALVDDVERFWDAVVADVPRLGAWFPRVELVAGSGPDPAPRLRCLRRPAPPRRPDAVVATAPHDPRTAPLVKGPDLAALGRLREAVRPLGADEAVLLAADGTVVEGAWSSVVWWEGDALCLPPDDEPRLPGVTLGALVALASALGVEVRGLRRRPDELAGCEVWLLSALHGPRIVTRWVDGPSLAEEPGRLRAWRARLDALRRPL